LGLEAEEVVVGSTFLFLGNVWVDSGGGTSSSVSEVTSTVRDSHLFVSHVRQREAYFSVEGSSVFDLERSNREGSGSFSVSTSYLRFPVFLAHFLL
jgi:hypothetical protein